jgi:hypothetical protein
LGRTTSSIPSTASSRARSRPGSSATSKCVGNSGFHCTSLRHVRVPRPASLEVGGQSRDRTGCGVGLQDPAAALSAHRL